MQVMLDNNFEIVSYGLAPNPNGFCYEYQGIAANRSKTVEEYINQTLDTLTCEETKLLKEWAL